METLIQPTKAKFPRKAALEVARQMVLALEPYCERIIVAGSLRRRKALVGDVEIIFIPKTVAIPVDMFASEQAPATWSAFERMLKEEVVHQRPSVTGTCSWGPKNKLAVHVASGIPVDFFSATQENWFSYLVCRTGGAENNIAIAAAAKRKGWKYNPYGAGFTDEEGNTIPITCEADAFTMVGLIYLDPWNRR